MGPEFAWNRWDPSTPSEVRPFEKAEDYDVWNVMWRVQRNF